jgi:2-iminobutanoate/2-iminopropanoate deaminase
MALKSASVKVAGGFHGPLGAMAWFGRFRTIAALDVAPFRGGEAQLDHPETPMTINTCHDIGVARQIGRSSDAVEAPANARWLVTAGTPGLALDGALPPDIAGQAELAWTHIETMLKRAGMSVRDLVKVTQYLLHASDIPAYANVRAKFLRDARPASMLLIVPGLVRPDFLLEIEAWAAKT